MVYSEFCEGLCAVALYKMCSPYVSVARRLDNFICKHVLPKSYQRTKGGKVTHGNSTVEQRNAAIRGKLRSEAKRSQAGTMSDTTSQDFHSVGTVLAATCTHVLMSPTLQAVGGMAPGALYTMNPDGMSQPPRTPVTPLQTVVEHRKGRKRSATRRRSRGSNSDVKTAIATAKARGKRVTKQRRRSSIQGWEDIASKEGISTTLSGQERYRRRSSTQIAAAAAMKVCTYEVAAGVQQVSLVLVRLWRR